MKKLFTLISLGCLVGTAALAQENTTNGPATAPSEQTGTNEIVHLRSAEAKTHVGANAIVTGKVAEVNQGASVVRLNFDEPFPHQTFTAIIFSRNTNQFGNLDGLKDKTVEVSGKIALYRGRAEIQLQKTNQLRVVEDPTAATKP